MRCLLDTNVVSEWVKPRPNPHVVAWLDSVDEEDVFLSAVTIGELRYGMARLPAGGRRERLFAWLRDELLPRFETRVLAIDTAVAEMWGDVVATADTRGRPIGAIDAYVAAVARVHELTLVTRNVADFDGVFDRIFDPWSGDPPPAS
ncbi:MAG: recombinase [Acidobacteria bacterium SCN 69-37]|nr:MAG: recombinase [Acidobacteria bacterium SCN 69-37]